MALIFTAKTASNAQDGATTLANVCKALTTRSCFRLRETRDSETLVHSSVDSQANLDRGRLARQAQPGGGLDYWWIHRCSLDDRCCCLAAFRCRWLAAFGTSQDRRRCRRRFSRMPARISGSTCAGQRSQAAKLGPRKNSSRDERLVAALELSKRDRAPVLASAR